MNERCKCYVSKNRMNVSTKMAPRTISRPVRFGGKKHGNCMY